MRLFGPRSRDRLRSLDERECYLRLHGARSGDVELLEARPPARRDGAGAREPLLRPATAPSFEAAPGRPGGPTDLLPALHLVIAYPRSGARLTGEQVRRELLRRMQARAREAA